MAKRKDLLLKESTVSRMMGLAGIGALTNPFLRESYGEEQEMEEGYGREEELDEMHDEEGMGHDALGHGDIDYDADDFRDFEDEEDMDSDEEESDDEEEFDDEEELEEAKEPCKKCGEIHEGSSCSGYMQENIHKSMKRLKRLLEQAEGDVPPPAPEGDVPPPESAPGGDDQMESKIKDFVKKLGELVQETLGVEVTVEEGEGEPEMPPAPEGGEAAPPAPMAEAINRLVNKVAHRVKARLMEAQKGKKETEMRMKQRSKAKKAAEDKKEKLMKEKQMAAKKKQMEMKKKKAAMSKKK
jgi:hypothetical protein